jgi:peptidoglycan hydrolase-like protein with peptidoglycan-binding domain
MKIKRISVFIVSLAVIVVAGFSLDTGSARAATSIPQITRDLQLGSIGSDVKGLQQFLNNNGYTISSSGVGSPGKETTYFGALTKAALANFQAANGITATGYFGSKTRSFLSTMTGSSAVSTLNSSTASLITTLQQQIAALQAQLNALMSVSTSTDSSDPYVYSISVSNGGDDGYIDVGDTITITFNEAINPESINDSLYDGTYISGITYSETGGVTVSSSGKVTIKGIASFYVGSVENSGTFTVGLSLDSSGTVLNVILTSGSDINITSEDFHSAVQIGGTIEDEAGNYMAGYSINEPTGTFGGSSDAVNPYIYSISVSNGGDDGYIDIGDTITITFNEPIEPTSINDSLYDGTYVSDVAYSEIGGVAVSSSGKVTVRSIAYFYVEGVEDSGTFTVGLSLDSSGEVLNVILTSGSDIAVSDGDLISAAQIGGTVEDEVGNLMETDSSIDNPTGAF